MIEVIKDKIKNLKNNDEKINIAREFLQILILKILRDKNAFKNLAFVGGTSLRILYGLKRFSEDLDFSITKKTGYEFIKLIEALKKELELLNLKVSLKYKSNIVDNCFIKFENVLQELGLHIHREEKLPIKIEIDTNPPKGANLEEKLINEHFIFNLIIYDISSLMAGKLHAVLCRKYSKGRDFYDLVWYLTKGISPNIKLLNNSIMQTEKEDWKVTNIKWKKVVFDKIKDLNFKKIQNDVTPFLWDKKEAELIALATFEKLLKD